MTAPDRERLMAYLDGELPALERTAVERELEASEEARQLLAELAALDALARSQSVEAPDGYFDALPGRIRGRLEAGGRRRRALPAWTWAAAAAAAVAALAPLTLSRLDEAPPPAAVPPVSLTDAEPAGDEDRAAASEPMPEAAPRAQRAPDARPAPSQAPASTAPRPTPAPERRRAARAAAAPEASAQAEGGRRAEPPAAGFSEAPRPAERAEAARETAGEAAVRPPPPAAASVASALEEDRDAGPAAGDSRPAAALAKRQAADVAVGADAERFTRLAARRPRTAEEARSLREDWRGFVLLYPESALADEARVRTVESGLEAWRLGDEEADRQIARRDAEAYLARDDAAQTGRVEALLAALERTP